MLKHAGMFESQPSLVSSFNNPTNIDGAWRSWLDRETKNRYVSFVLGYASRGLLFYAICGTVNLVVG